MWEMKREEGIIRGGGRHNLREVERRNRLLFRSGGCNGWIWWQNRSEGGVEQAIMKEGDGDGSSNWVEEGRDGESLEVEVMVR